MRRALCSILVLLVAPPIWADDVKKIAARTFHVPYRLTSTNHVLIRVKINGKGPYNFILDKPWPLFPPGMAIFLTVLAFNLIGDGLRDSLGRETYMPKGLGR